MFYQNPFTGLCFFLCVLVCAGGCVCENIISNSRIVGTVLNFGDTNLVPTRSTQNCVLVINV